MPAQPPAAGQRRKPPKAAILLGSTILITAILTGLLLSGFLQNPYLRKAEKLSALYDLPEAYTVLKAGIARYPANAKLNYLIMKIINTAKILQFYEFEFADAAEIQTGILATRQTTSDARLLTEMGYAYWIMNEPAKAEQLWAAAIGQDPAYYPAYNYLGNLYYNTDHARGMAYYEKLFSLKPRALNFIGVRIAEENLLRKIAQQQGLKTIYLSGESGFPPDRLRNLPQLEFLYMSGLQLTSEHLKYLNSLRNLQALILSANNLTTLRGLAGLTKLKLLYLDKNIISRIENLDTFTGLHTLNLRNNRLTSLENLEPLRQLKYLYLSGNRISRLENLEHQSRLQTLDLYRNKISRLENLSGLSSLRILDLYGNQLGKLENLDSLSKLQALYLRLNSISLVENLDNLHALEILDLGQNRIGSSGELYITLPAGLKNLKSISFSGPGYNNPGSIRYLKGVENCIRLTELILEYQDLRELPDLAGLPHLRTLRIEQCRNLRKIDYSRVPVGLETLILWNANLTDLAGIARLVNLRKIWLGDNPDLVSLAGLEQLAGLRELNAGLCPNLRPAEIDNLPQLTTLILAVGQYPPSARNRWQAAGITVKEY